MGYVTIGAGRNFLILLFSQPPAMNRGVVFGDLVHTQRRIIAAHEIRIRVAPATYFDKLRARGLTDVTLFSIHALETHNSGVTAVASDAAKTFGGMDVVFV